MTDLSLEMTNLSLEMTDLSLEMGLKLSHSSLKLG